MPEPDTEAHKEDDSFPAKTKCCICGEAIVSGDLYSVNIRGEKTHYNGINGCLDPLSHLEVASH